MVQKHVQKNINNLSGYVQQQLANYEFKELGEYGTGGTEQEIPQYLRDMAQFGMGKNYVNAQYQNQSRGIIEQTRENAKSAEKQFAGGGLASGFGQRELAGVFRNEFRGLASLRDMLENQNQAAMLEGEKGIFEVEQSNMNRALQYQMARANQDFSLFQLTLGELQAQRDLMAQSFYGG